MAVSKKANAPRTHESMGMFSHSSYEIETAISIANGIHGVLLLDAETAFVQFDSDSVVYVYFDNLAADNISTTNNLRYPDNTIVTEVAPVIGSKATRYIHFKQVTSSNAGETVRIIQR